MAVRESEPFAELLADAPELVRALAEDRYRRAEHRRAAVLKFLGVPIGGDFDGALRVLDRLQLAADLVEALHDAGEIDAGVGSAADPVDTLGSRFDPATEVGDLLGRGSRPAFRRKASARRRRRPHRRRPRLLRNRSCRRHGS